MNIICILFFEVSQYSSFYSNFRNSELTSDNNAVDNLFKFLASKENDTVRVRVINIMGRNVKFAKSCGRVLDTTFEELCDRVGLNLISK